MAKETSLRDGFSENAPSNGTRRHKVIMCRGSDYKNGLAHVVDRGKVITYAGQLVCFTDSSFDLTVLAPLFIVKKDLLQTIFVLAGFWFVLWI